MLWEKMFGLFKGQQMIFSRFDFFKSIRNKLIAVLLTGIIIVIFLIKQDRTFTSLEKIPQFLQLNQASKKKCSMVEVGFHVNDFPAFSFIKNEFLIDGIVWFKFPSGTDSIDTIKEFSLQNSLVMGAGELSHKSAPIIKLIDDQVLLCYHIQSTFKGDPNYKNFPLSSHTLSIIVLNKSVTPYELSFTSDNNHFTFDNKRTFNTWKLEKTFVSTGYIESQLLPNNPAMKISYPSVAFSMNFANDGVRDLVSLYLPIFVLFFIALFSLLLRIDDPERLIYVAEAVPLLILFRLVIDSISPIIGYTTHIDFIYYAVVFLSLLILLFQTYVTLALQHATELIDLEQKKMRETLKLINDEAFFFSLLLLLGFVFYSFYR